MGQKRSGRWTIGSTSVVGDGLERGDEVHVAVETKPVDDGELR